MALTFSNTRNGRGIHPDTATGPKERTMGQPLRLWKGAFVLPEQLLSEQCCLSNGGKMLVNRYRDDKREQCRHEQPAL